MRCHLSTTTSWGAAEKSHSTTKVPISEATTALVMSPQSPSEDDNTNDDISTFWRTFIVKEEQKLYSQFRISQFTTGSVTSFKIFMIFYTLIFITRYLKVLLYPGDHHIGLLFKFAILFGLIFSFIPGWIIIYSLHVKADLDVVLARSLRFLKIRNYPIFRQFSYVDFTILSFTTFWAMLLVARAVSGPCYEEIAHNYTVVNTSDCNPGFNLGILPQDTVLVLVLGVSSSQALLKGSCWAVILTAWFIQLAAVVISFSILESINSSIVPQILVCQLVVLYAHENQLLLHYQGLLHQKRLLLDSLAKNNQKVAAEEQTKDVQYLIANTAHDLKTPLQVLEMGADDIRKRLDSLPISLVKLPHSIGIPLVSNEKEDHSQVFLLPESERSAILETTGIIASTVVFMSMTINRVLDFSKVSHNIKLVPAYETINLSAVIAWPASILRSLEGRVSIIIEIIPSNISHFVITDKGWLTENLLCLFSNAIKYSSDGYVSVRCYLIEDKSRLKVSTNITGRSSEWNKKSNETTNDSYSICVEVEDTGIGIPQESRARLFSPFQQAQRMTTGGTGLGLYSLRKRIEALGGGCGIKNRHDKKEGSCFWFTFPYRPDYESYSEGTITPSSGSRTATVSRRGSVEEDDKLDSRILSVAKLLDSTRLAQMSSVEKDRHIENNWESSFMESKCSKEISILLVDDSMSILKMCARSLTREVFIYLHQMSSDLRCSFLTLPPPPIPSFMIIDYFLAFLIF